jgi:hypothetical protein
MSSSLGKYYDQVNAGRVFIGNTAAAGVASPISTGTAVTFGIWNTSQTHNAVLLWCNIGYTSGTIALGAFGLANQNVGFNIATGAAMTAFTEGTPKNAKVGAGNASRMKFTPSGATLAAGGTSLMTFDGGKASATAALGEINGLGYEFDGSVIVTPGQLVFVASSIAQTGVYTMSMAWAEVEID